MSVAHIGHAELPTPDLTASTEFFTDILGMRVVESDAASVYLRGYGQYQRVDLRLTAAGAPGLGHLGLRGRSQAALDRCVAALDHVRLLSGDMLSDRRLAQDALGYRLLDRVLDDDGVEVGAWMSTSIAPLELVDDPDPPLRTWTAAERARGIGSGTRFPASWRTYGTPPVVVDA